MQYINVTSTEQRILCCNCGVPIAPNPANMCVDCIRNEVDITEGIPKQSVLYFCSFCDRYLQPPSQWVACELESRELLALCLKKMKGLSKVRLVDAGFVWTEPHSKRIKVKLTIQKEVFASTILQQVFIVEYIVAHQMCDECRRVEAKDTWRAAVQIRQKVAHKRTFLYLEQLILRHNLHKLASNIKEVPDGLDFYFGSKGHAVKLSDFLQSVIPVRYKTSQELVSMDSHSNSANYKYTYSVEIVPVCKDDLVCLPKNLRASLGGISPLVVCYRVGNSLHLIDPSTLQVAEISPAVYWRAPFPSLCTQQELIEFVVIDIEPLGPTRGKFVLADITVARKSDFGYNDTMFYLRTFLGAYLQPGDHVFGYDIASSNFNNDHFDLLDRRELPDIILVKKAFPNRRRKNRPRNWKLMHINKDATMVAPEKGRNGVSKAEEDYEHFLRELEEDPELRAGVNLYKDANARPAFDTASVTDGEDAPEEDFPEVGVDELLDEMEQMQLDDPDADPDEGGYPQDAMME